MLDTKVKSVVLRLNMLNTLVKVSVTKPNMLPSKLNAKFCDSTCKPLKAIFVSGM